MVYVILTVERLQNPSNRLLLALASADLLAGAIAQPMSGIYFAFFHSSNRCDVEKAILFVSVASCLISVLLLCLIARDRYLHLSKGLAYNQFASKRKISFQILGSWVMGLITAGAHLLLLKGSELKQHQGSIVSSALILFMILSSFIYTSVTYFRIKKILQVHSKRMRDKQDTHDGCQVSSIPATRLDAQRSYNTTMLMILSLFAIAFLPFMIIFAIRVSCQIKKETPGIWLQKGFRWTRSLIYFNGAINPFIYAIRYKDVGREMKNLIQKMFCLTALKRYRGDRNKENTDSNTAFGVNSVITSDEL